MKNKIIIAILGLAFIIPTISFALTEQKYEDIRPITTTIPGDIDPTATVACADLTRNLRFGMKDSDTFADVSMLQDFLSSKGHLKVTSTGFFGKVTFKAVVDFQKSNGIMGTGYVGPITRAKIKAIDCTGTTSEYPEKIVLQKLYTENKDNMIEKCTYNDQMVFRLTPMNTTGVGFSLFDKDGKKIAQILSVAGSEQTNEQIIKSLKDCRVIYRANLSSPVIDVYNLARNDIPPPTVDPKKETVKKISELHPKAQIEECKHAGVLVYRVEFDVVTETGGGSYATYNEKGVLITREDTPGVTEADEATIRNVTNCKTVYLPSPNKYGKAGVNTYKVETKPVVYEHNTIALDTQAKMYKDTEYKITNTNSKITITGFYNHPCPPTAMCIWSGLDVFYRIDPISGKGPSYAKTEINQSTAGFPFTVTIKDSDYTNFAEVVLSNKIDALPGSGDN